MVPKIILILAMVSLASCAGMTAVNVRTDFTGLAYNDVAEKYMQRPIYAQVITNPGLKGELLSVNMSTYSEAEGFAVSKPFVDDNIAAIKKFLKWEAIASAKGDAVDLKIGTVKAFDNGVYMYTDYMFTSGNTHRHYLAIGHNSWASSGDGYMYLDRPNAIKLIKLLNDFKNDHLSKMDISVYK